MAKGNIGKPCATRLDMTEFTSEFLTVVEFVESRNHKVFWLVKCRCGNEKVMTTGAIKGARSCCLECPLVYKQSNGSRLYNRWSSMKQRCYNPRHRRYKDYGGRGIGIYKEWLESFLIFRDYCYKIHPDLDSLMDKGYHLDREDNEGSYEPGNIRFIPPIINCNNRRNLVEFRGTRSSKKDLWRSYAHETVTYSILKGRIREGWSLEKALLTPIQRIRDKSQSTGLPKPIGFQGKDYKSMKELWRNHAHGSVSYPSFVTRVRLNWEVERALRTPTRQTKRTVALSPEGFKV